jgi:hypothetical protein
VTETNKPPLAVHARPTSENQIMTAKRPSHPAHTTSNAQDSRTNDRWRRAYAHTNIQSTESRPRLAGGHGLSCQPTQTSTAQNSQTNGRGGAPARPAYTNIRGAESRTRLAGVAGDAYTNMQGAKQQDKLSLEAGLRQHKHPRRKTVEQMVLGDGPLPTRTCKAQASRTNLLGDGPMPTRTCKVQDRRTNGPWGRAYALHEHARCKPVEQMVLGDGPMPYTNMQGASQSQSDKLSGEAG